jgi:hypothetical protein
MTKSQMRFGLSVSISQDLACSETVVLSQQIHTMTRIAGNHRQSFENRSSEKISIPKL